MSAIALERGRPGAAPSRVNVPLALAAAVCLVVLLAAAYRALPQQAAAPIASTVAPVASAPDRMAIVVAGIPADLTPDTLVPVMGAISARISLERVAGRPGGRELGIVLGDEAGLPVEGAALRLTGQMRFMDHGAFQATAQAEGAGRYTAHLAFAMPGEYEIRLNVTTAGSTASLVLDVDLPN